VPDKYDIADPNDPNTLRVPFMWVPHGCEPDPEWLRAHPGWVRIPAVMMPRDPHPGESGPQWNVQLGAPGEPAAPPAAAPPAAPEPEPRTFFAPVGRATDWPVDRDGRPWPRTAFGQPQCPLNEFPPGMRAPGEAIPPEDRLEYFDPTKFDPIGTFLAMKPCSTTRRALLGSWPPRVRRKWAADPNRSYRCAQARRLRRIAGWAANCLTHPATLPMMAAAALSATLRFDSPTRRQ
jgi:hypothetical protein